MKKQEQYTIVAGIRGWKYLCGAPDCFTAGGSVDYDRCEDLAKKHVEEKHPGVWPDRTANGMRVVEFGDEAPGKLTWCRVSSRGNKIHLAVCEPYQTHTLCGSAGLGINDTEFMSGNLCLACEKLAEERTGVDQSHDRDEASAP